MHRKELKNFYNAQTIAYGPQSPETTAVLSVNGNTLLTDKYAGRKKKRPEYFDKLYAYTVIGHKKSTGRKVKPCYSTQIHRLVESSLMADAFCRFLPDALHIIVFESLKCVYTVTYVA